MRAKLIYRTIDEIRNSLGISQDKFCKMIGVSLRTYYNRVHDKYLQWSLAEVIKAAKMNDGQICVRDTDGTEYNIDIHEV